jgi:superfamily I DNA and/or RNA helicase
MTQSVDDITAVCDVIWHQNGFTKDPPFIREFKDTLDNLQDVSEKIKEIDEARSKQQEIQAKYEAVEKRIPIPLGELSSEYRQKLESLAIKVGLPENERSIFRKLFDLILMRKFISNKSEKELRKLLPQLAEKTYKSVTLRVRVLRLCGDIADYLEVQSEEIHLKDMDFELPVEQLNHLANEMAIRRKNLKSAFLFNRVAAVQSVSADVRQQLKDAAHILARKNNLPFLTQILPESSIANAQNAFQQFAKFFPAWATTLLSLSKASPCIAGLFDRVIIDEASQCEIPPIIPALYRAKGVTIIGDSAQFPPVITMREERHEYIRSIKHKLTDPTYERFDFIENSAFDLIDTTPLMLREHFRCHEDIAAFFSEEYYSDKLKVKTNSSRLKFPKNMGFKRALEWRSVDDSVDEEVEEVKKLLLELQSNGYDGTVGVISPFRKLADRLKQELCSFHALLDLEKDVNTANGFQGGERDLIIFVLGITSKLSHGEDWYAVATENRYIYNVAVSRARACLIIVGDRERAKQSTSSALKNLAKDINQRPVRKLSQSPGEEMLYKALCAAGLKPVQQYPLAGRYLDMALVDEKIDIEVDGEAYHLNMYGERKQDDIFRDLQVQSNGWCVCRFWFWEVRDNLEECIAKIQNRINA